MNICLSDTLSSYFQVLLFKTKVSTLAEAQNKAQKKLSSTDDAFQFQIVRRSVEAKETMYLCTLLAIAVLA